ncbi:T9SS type A sorting domain-containing protein [Flavobacterium sp. CYK-55]|uniref:M12 family metallo-peptidase n=1 Tax=Flavobacterium sp. CYK-55 TaxID=2835529 RepID=UPI001BCEC08C|nr:M12 family metallo-peptidase [Flavobacterium sp. CYK-55]MBS7787613.1 T9SS type A sorting domain-containing protein [Flavobacterium sp. CYK-55]
MKKLLTLGLLVFATTLFAQKKVAQKVQELISRNETFPLYSILSESNLPLSADAKKTVDKASMAELQLDVLHQLMTDHKNTLEITVPYQQKSITLQMYRADVLAEGFHVDTPTQRNIGYAPGLYYRGIIKGDQNSLVAFSFFNDELYGVISAEGIGNIVVAKIRKQNNTSNYLVYSDAELKINHNFNCHTRDNTETTTTTADRSNSALSQRCVTIYFEVDNDLYQDNNSNSTTTTNWMTAVFNNVQTIYSNDGITTAIKSIYIWTTADPYDGIGTSSSDYLFKFNEVRPVFDGDLGQLVGRDDGGLGGVAVGINGICTQDNFSYSDLSIDYNTVPVFSWTIEVITHELGHLMGSPHTHACVWNGNNTAIDGCGPTANSSYAEGSCDTGPVPSNSVKGTIMSYCHLLNVGINFSNGFGPQPAARILGKVNGGTCLSTDCINTCINTVSSISTTNVTSGTAQITWVDNSGTTNWQVAVTPFTSTNIIWNNVSTPSYSAAGLSSNVYYKVRVRPICSGGLFAPDEKAIVITGANYCSGVAITDTGGSNDDYEDSESYIRTIIPNLPNKKIRLTFTEFDLEQDYDYLYVYDGNSTSANDLSGGGFTGNSIPGPFVSSAADGSLTIKFYSDGGVTAAGYQANIACENALGNNVFESDIDFTYWPNPVKGNLNISARLNLSEVMVHNLEGRLMFQKQINKPDAQVDLSTFARGTYFFTLKFGDREAHFKVIKN